MPSMRIPVLALIALGTIVGTVDVISVAFAEQQGSQPPPASCCRFTRSAPARPG